MNVTLSWVSSPSLSREKVEVYWGGAPHSQLYENRASLTTLVDQNEATLKHALLLARLMRVNPDLTKPLSSSLKVVAPEVQRSPTSRL